MSEEKTRIVPRSAPDDGDTITFKCENGHRINVPAKLAGKRGTCSKCGIPVVIPGPGPVVAPEPSAVEPAVPEVAPDVPVPAPAQAPSVPVAAPATADTFSHLFDTAGPAEEVIDVSAGLPEGASGVGSVVGDVLVRDAPEEFATPDDAAGAEHPTAQLVARLWLERNHGGKFELHLVGGGSPIMPEWYEARWSRGTHGLFANQAADGTVTLTAVAWESVQKIIVRQVEGLPDGMFE